MSFIVKNINYLLNSRDLTPTTITKVVKVKQPTIFRIAKGEITEPKESTLQPLAKFFGYSVEQLRHVDIEALESGKISIEEIESISRIKNKAGNVPLFNINSPSLCFDNIEHINNEWIVCPAMLYSQKTFAIKIIDDALFNPSEGFYFRKDDIIFIDPEAEIKEGSFVLAMVKQERKRFIRQICSIEGENYLKSLNPHLHNQLIKLDDNIKICGVAIYKSCRL